MYGFTRTPSPSMVLVANSICLAAEDMGAAMDEGAVVDQSQTSHEVDILEMRTASQSPEMTSDELTIRSTLLAARASKRVTRASKQFRLCFEHKIIGEALFRDCVDSYGRVFWTNAFSERASKKEFQSCHWVKSRLAE